MIDKSKKWLWRIIIGLLFVVSLSYVLFWANGFQYDFISNQFRKTGIIAVEYADSEAEVILNGERLDGALPLIISNLLPGLHDLVVVKEGFWDYHAEIEVQPDLITRINSIFLVPINGFEGVEKVYAPKNEQISGVWMDAGYIFLKHEVSEVEYLSFARIQDPILKFSTVPSEIKDVTNIDVWGRNVLISGKNGEREVFDLFSVEDLKEIPLSDRYVFAGDKWLYFEDDFISAFDKNFTRVLWTKHLKPDVLIGGLRYFSEGGREFVAVDYELGMGHEFYELDTDRFNLIDTGVVTWVGADRLANVYYVKNNSEFWSYSLFEKEGSMMARFYKSFRMISADLRPYSSTGVFLFEREGDYWLSDGSLKNVRQLFEGKNIVEMDSIDGNKIYFWVNQSSDEGNSSGLYVYKLEG